MKEKVGNPDRKEMTSRGDFQRSNGVNGVGWRGQSHRCNTVCSSIRHSRQTTDPKLENVQLGAKPRPQLRSEKAS